MEYKLLSELVIKYCKKVKLYIGIKILHIRKTLKEIQSKFLQMSNENLEEEKGVFSSTGEERFPITEPSLAFTVEVNPSSFRYVRILPNGKLFLNMF